jgi:hypothetical protein
MNTLFQGMSKQTFTILASLLMVYTTHYSSAKIYDTLCVPDGPQGYIQGFFTTASPWCRLVLDIMKNTENQYSTAVLVGISYLVVRGLDSLNKILTPPSEAR